MHIGAAGSPQDELLAHGGRAGQHCTSSGKTSLHCPGIWPEKAGAALWTGCHAHACPGEHLQMSLCPQHSVCNDMTTPVNMPQNRSERLICYQPEVLDAAILMNRVFAELAVSAHAAFIPASKDLHS